MTLFSVDPGTEQSALVVTGNHAPIGRILPNPDLLAELRRRKGITAHLVIEQMACYGMPVGAEVLDTCVWIGRFIEAWDQAESDASWSLLPRKAVKLALCGSMKAKDSNVRQALIDRYGGPSCVKKGGPLYGIKSHMWSSLALAVTWQQLEKEAGR